MRTLQSRLVIGAILLFFLSACGSAQRDESGSDSDQTKLELPENSLEGPPYSFHGTKTGPCTVTSFAGSVIMNGYFRVEIVQTETLLNVQLFCAPDKNATSGYKLYTTGNLRIDGNTVEGPGVQSGRIGRKGLKLILLPLQGVQYTITALVDSQILFEVNAFYNGREVERMTGHF